MKTVVTKGQYAARKERGPSAVSNWIAEGKLKGDALIGEGNRARIWVEEADRQLALHLDPSQQAAQVTPVVSNVAAPLVPEAKAANLQDNVAAPRSADDDVMRRRRLAEAEKAEHDAEAARRKNAIDEGRWIDASEAMREWGRELARIRTETETFLFTTLARSLADKHGLDWKTLAVELRDLYRRHCSGVANEAGEQLTEREAELAQAAE